MNAPRSGCPINLTLEALGDRWSLIVIRDLMFGNRRHFRELLTRSEERIASNILADRLKPTSALLASLAITGSQRRSAAPSRLSVHLRVLRVKPGAGARVSTQRNREELTITGVAKPARISV